MSEELVICLRCGSDCAYKTQHGLIKAWNCMGCGFSTLSTLEEGSDYQKQYEENLPELYKDLKFIDVENKAWYPSTINFPEKGIIFANGPSKNNWRWTAMKSTEVKDNEKEKFKKPNTVDEYFTHKMDPKTAKDFNQRGFMDAAEYIGLFNNETNYGIN